MPVAGERKQDAVPADFIVPSRYKTIKRLGSGSYGTVVLALDTETKKNVAIKKCQTVFKYPEDGKRVLREIKLMKQMDHRNVLTVNDMLVPNETEFNDVYIVLDAMETDLSKVLRSDTQLTEQHCKYIIYQILRALKYIHSAEVLHRDLKPANILMNFDCRAKICDFGLARGYNPQQKGQQMTNYVVTRWYRAPELLLDNHNYDGAVDIWAAGCIFAEMLRGEALFPGDSSNAQLKLICNNIGVPAENDLSWIVSGKHKDYILRLGQGRTAPDLATLMPRGTNPLAIDFLRHMLAFCPEKRWSADWLLEHPYLADLHRPDSCTVSENVFKWKWDSDCPTADQLRHLFWEEVLRHHPEAPNTVVPSTARPAECTAFNATTRRAAYGSGLEERTHRLPGPGHADRERDQRQRREVERDTRIRKTGSASSTASSTSSRPCGTITNFPHVTNAYHTSTRSKAHAGPAQPMPAA